MTGKYKRIPSANPQRRLRRRRKDTEASFAKKPRRGITSRLILVLMIGVPLSIFLFLGIGYLTDHNRDVEVPRMATERTQTPPPVTWQGLQPGQIADNFLAASTPQERLRWVRQPADVADARAVLCISPETWTSLLRGAAGWRMLSPPGFFFGSTFASGPAGWLRESGSRLRAVQVNPLPILMRSPLVHPPGALSPLRSGSLLSIATTKILRLPLSVSRAFAFRSASDTTLASSFLATIGEKRAHDPGPC